MPFPIRLYYDNDGEYLPLPDWASFLLDLGWDIGQIEDLGKRLVLVLVLPTRAYAAALIATGIVLSRSVKSSSVSTPAAEHFEQLCSLPPGTSVFLLEGNSKKRGTIRGCVEKLHGIGPLIGIEVLKGEVAPEITWVPPSRSLRIEIAGSKPNTPPVKATGGQKIIQNAQFVESLAQHMNIWEFGLRSALECIMLGDINLLRREVIKQVFAVKILGPNITKMKKSLSKHKIRKVVNLLHKDYTHRD